MRVLLCCVGAAAFLPSVATPALAQRDEPSRVRHGIAIGDVPRVRGLRLNFRDRRLERVDGVNVTLWSPYEPARGEVRGLALGLPLTGAGSVEGAALGLGIGASDRVHGIGVGVIGVGAGGGLRGVMLGGIGVGSGGSIRGITLGGAGVGAGGEMRGLQVGGIGVGSGGGLTGISVGGIGAASGGDVRGLTIAGVGVGSGGRITGISLAGLGIGSGGGMTGIQLAGLGLGTGGTLRGLSVAGLAVGAPRIEGVAAAAAVGGQEVRGAVLAPLFFRIENDGTLRGMSASAVNWIQGSQRGLTIGLVNFAQRLDGLQVGLLNIVRENPSGRRVLPIVNWGR